MAAAAALPVGITDMNIAIVGDGKVGFALTEQLSKENHNIVVIDSNLENLKNVQDVLDVLIIHGNGASMAVQREAGVDKADLLIAATSSDELNILACLVAKRIGAKQTIARVRNPEYADQLQEMKDDLGLSMSINPELAAATEIARRLRFPSALNIDVFAKGRIELVEFRIPPENVLAGMKLSELNQRLKVNVLICAVQRGEATDIPSGNFELETGDRVTLTASPVEIAMFFKNTGIYQQKIRSVIMIGGGRTTFYLARQLCDMGMEVKILEEDNARCRTLSEALPKAVVLNAKSNDRELLQDENIEGADALLALTDSDERNIFISIYARAKKVPKVITKLERMDNVEVLGYLGLESVVSPRQLTANSIVRYVRAMANTKGSSIVTLHRIVNDKAEALEFHVRSASELTGRNLAELPIKSGILVAVINRGGKIIIPRGSDTIEEGDDVIVITARRSLLDLEDILDTQKRKG